MNCKVPGVRIPHSPLQSVCCRRRFSRFVRDSALRSNPIIPLHPQGTGEGFPRLAYASPLRSAFGLQTIPSVSEGLAAQTCQVSEGYFLRSDVDGPSIGPSMTFWGVFDVEGPDCGPSTSLEGPHYVTAGDGDQLWIIVGRRRGCRPSVLSRTRSNPGAGGLPTVWTGGR